MNRKLLGKSLRCCRAIADAVGIFVNGNADEIRNTANAAGVRCVQLHGDFSPDVGRELAREFRVIQAFSTHPQFRPDEVLLFPDCDVLVDAHHPDLRGGTGQTCDWSAARATLPFSRFLILSGGLNAENVAGAIKAVTPHAVDVCSGVESAPGVKNRDAIKDFIAAVRAAERSLGISTYKPPHNVILSEEKNGASGTSDMNCQAAQGSGE